MVLLSGHPSFESCLYSQLASQPFKVLIFKLEMIATISILLRCSNHNIPGDDNSLNMNIRRKPMVSVINVERISRLLIWLFYETCPILLRKLIIMFKSSQERPGTLSMTSPLAF